MRYKSKFTINAPIQAVATFHRDTRALKQLTPPPMDVEFISIEPLAESSRAEFAFKLGFLTIDWVAIHSDVDPLEGFTDTQLEGPFSHWVHKHEFIRVDESTTLVVDEINAKLGLCVKEKVVSVFMWCTLPLLFTYRKLLTKRLIYNNLNTLISQWDEANSIN